MQIEATLVRGVDRETVRRLSRRSNARGLVQLCLHGLLLCGTGGLVWLSRGSGLLVPAILLHGLVLNFLFCGLHESIHRTAFATGWINESVAWGCGALLLLPPRFFRFFHFTHHRFTMIPGKDPELVQGSSSYVSVASYVWRASGFPNWHKRLTITLRHALTGRVPEPYVPAAKRRLVVREARVLWLCYLTVLAISVAFRSANALIYWILPAMAGQPFLRLYLMAEHAGCAYGDDAFANTRTTYTNGAVRLLAWQMPYHVEHHLIPSVPFHALVELNALIRDRITMAAPGYLAVHRRLLRQCIIH